MGAVYIALVPLARQSFITCSAMMVLPAPVGADTITE